MSDLVLVTGATGFIGRALVGRLRERGGQVLAFSSSDGDIADASIFRKLNDCALSHVIHLAGTSYVPESWRAPASFIRTNVQGTANVLELCRARKVGLTHLSAYVFGVPERLPVAEDAPRRPNNPYAMSKYLAEELCRFFSEAYGVPVTVLRPFNVYGPGQDSRFLIPHVVAQLRGPAIEVKDLSPRRDYVHVDDVVEGILRGAERQAGYNVFNLGAGSSHSVADIVRIAQKAAGTDLPVVCSSEPRRDEIPDVVADIRLARRVLGWEPRIGLDAGIRILVRPAA